MKHDLEKIGVNQLAILDLLKDRARGGDAELNAITRKEIEESTGLSLGQTQSALRGLGARGVKNRRMGPHVRSPRVYWYAGPTG